MKLILILFSITCAVSAQSYSPAIEDNSFFIEEAYNQEPGVIQHIFNGQYSYDNDFELMFTQEIPIKSQYHQFSYALSYLSLDKGRAKGIGDIWVNYRYQLTGKDEWAAISPRISVIIPVGERNNELGTDRTGYEFNLPVSKRLNENFTAHLNAGMTLFPEITEMVDERAVSGSFTSYHSGASLIWLASASLNFIFEYLVTYSSSLNPDGSSNFSPEHLLAPGIRYAVDIGNLQIVPGFAAVFISENDFSSSNYFFYLSFEHPF